MDVTRTYRLWHDPHAEDPGWVLEVEGAGVPGGVAADPVGWPDQGGDEPSVVVWAEVQRLYPDLVAWWGKPWQRTTLGAWELTVTVDVLGNVCRWLPDGWEVIDRSWGSRLVWLPRHGVHVALDQHDDGLVVTLGDDDGRPLHQDQRFPWHSIRDDVDAALLVAAWVHEHTPTREGTA